MISIRNDGLFSRRGSATTPGKQSVTLLAVFPVTPSIQSSPLWVTSGSACIAWHDMYRAYSFRSRLLPSLVYGWHRNPLTLSIRRQGWSGRRSTGCGWCRWRRLGMSRWDSGAGIMQSRNQILGAPNRDLEINLTPSQTSTDTVNLTPSQTNTQSN